MHTSEIPLDLTASESVSAESVDALQSTPQSAETFSESFLSSREHPLTSLVEISTDPVEDILETETTASEDTYTESPFTTQAVPMMVSTESSNESSISPSNIVTAVEVSSSGPRSSEGISATLSNEQSFMTTLKLEHETTSETATPTEAVSHTLEEGKSVTSVREATQGAFSRTKDTSAFETSADVDANAQSHSATYQSSTVSVAAQTAQTAGASMHPTGTIPTGTSMTFKPSIPSLSTNVQEESLTSVEGTAETSTDGTFSSSHEIASSQAFMTIHDVHSTLQTEYESQTQAKTLTEATTEAMLPASEDGISPVTSANLEASPSTPSTTFNEGMSTPPAREDTLPSISPNEETSALSDHSEYAETYSSVGQPHTMPTTALELLTSNEANTLNFTEAVTGAQGLLTSHVEHSPVTSVESAIETTLDGTFTPSDYTQSEPSVQSLSTSFGNEESPLTSEQASADATSVSLLSTPDAMVATDFGETESQDGVLSTDHAEQSTLTALEMFTGKTTLLPTSTSTGTLSSVGRDHSSDSSLEMQSTHSLMKTNPEASQDDYTSGPDMHTTEEVFHDTKSSQGSSERPITSSSNETSWFAEATESNELNESSSLPSDMQHQSTHDSELSSDAPSPSVTSVSTSSPETSLEPLHSTPAVVTVSTRVAESTATSIPSTTEFGKLY